MLRARVAAAPADGKANEALLRLLAKALGIGPSQLTLVAGAQARVKTVEVGGLALDDICSVLREPSSS